jgi:hypothetical protein
MPGLPYQTCSRSLSKHTKARIVFFWHCEQNRAQTLLDINTTGGERNALPLLIHALPFTPTEPLVKTEQMELSTAGDSALLWHTPL